MTLLHVASYWPTLQVNDGASASLKVAADINLKGKHEKIDPNLQLWQSEEKILMDSKSFDLNIRINSSKAGQEKEN